MNDSQRFELGMSQVFGKRLTYNQLTAKDSSPHHETTRDVENDAQNVGPIFIVLPMMKSIVSTPQALFRYSEKQDGMLRTRLTV
jgi:hypothetical protein